MMHVSKLAKMAKMAKMANISRTGRGGSAMRPWLVTGTGSGCWMIAAKGLKSLNV
jgi:hypothetical protein